MMRLAEQGPLVITVDDLHHADRISLQFLCYLARRILNKRVLLVLGVQSSAVPIFPLFQMEMSSQTNCRRVVLEPLSVHQVGALLRESAGGDDAARLASLYHALSGGNPLLVNALLADGLGSADALRAEDAAELPTRGAHLLQRMDRISADVAQGLSVLEATESRHLIDRLLRLDSALVRRAEHILYRSGILTAGQGYRHREARAAALESLPAERHADLHTEAARLLFREGTGGADVGTHLLAADSAKEPWAVPLLIEAAEQQLRADQLDQATAYVRLAQREAATEQQHADVTLMLARTEWRLNPAVVARHLAPRPGSSSEPALQSGQVVQMIKGLLDQRLLEQAQEAVRSAEDRLRALRLTGSTFEALGITLRALIYADQYGPAYDWGEVLFKDANDRNEPAWLVLFATIMAEAALGRGELGGAAAEYVRTAVAWRAELNGSTESGISLAVRILVLVESGDLDGAGRLISQPAPDTADHGREGLYFLHARSHYHLANQQPHMALRDFESCGQRMSAWGLDSPSFIPWRTDRAQALIALHRYDEARELAAEQLALLGPLQRRTRAMTTRVLAEATSPDQRPALLEEALHVMAEVPDHVEVARILGLFGRTHQALGSPI
ncbi:hypothetical protein AB0O76_16360 [Streptomyces sp. NPDC086554]|uniref:hypothetical protein n=1 Tax=Streptomyces sp. NPDC086554 TaxID=3154864 RepID=UPI00343CE395